MRLPGTRYQEHGWEQVRKLLGQCSLQAFRHADAGLLAACAPAALLDWYTDMVAAGLRRSAGATRADSAGNSYGESVAELALGLLCELPAQPAYWDGFVAALGRGHGALRLDGDAMLRKKVNDMFAGLRDKVDADAYQVALGRACSPNKMYTYRMLDTAYHEIAALFADWRQHAAQVGAILGRPLDGIPIEARQMTSIRGCKAEWIIRWSATLERFGAAPGPLHTRSKRFSSLKNQPATIAAMLAEIGDYEELSANRDSAEDWRGDAGEAAAWLEDYWRVMAEPEPEPEPEPGVGVERILAAVPDEFDGDGDDDGEAGAAARPPPRAPARTPQQVALDEGAAAGVSLPLGYIEKARAAQDGGSWALQLLKNESLPIRLAVYQKILGSADDAYPDAWRDPATGALPTLQQLAALDRISMPTLRKRRNEAIARLRAAGDDAAKTRRSL